MRIAILSGGSGWHVRDLDRAAARHGHATDLLDFRNLSARVRAGAGPFDAADAVIVRTMPPGSLEQVVFRMDLLHRLHERGTTVLNPPRALEICIDKFLATHRLENAGLLVPSTIVCETADDAMIAFADLGGDVVVKPLFGSEGRGMVRVTDEEIAWRTFRTLDRTDCALYLQQFIRHAGWDLRVFVIAGRVRAAMKRYARNDWRTNVAQGGRAEAVPVSPEEERLALRAAAACGVIVAGVDLIQGAGGEWYVIEVNAVPGWRALAPVTGVDVADEIVRHLQDTIGQHA